MRSLANYIEWHAALILFAFGTLAVNWKTDRPGLAVAIGIVGLLLFVASARSAYLYKSTALIDKYDERFFDKMRAERRGAARFLLGQQPETQNGPTGEDDLEDVLSFFEAPLASQLKAGQISAELTYDYFYHWVRLYYQSPVCQQYIERYCREEAASYSDLRDLYGKLQEMEKAAIERKKRPCKAEDYRLTPEKLKEYLEQEARLRI
jgi:hypothetical protein